MNNVKQRLNFIFSLGALFFSVNALSHQTSTAYFTGELNDSGAISGTLQVRLFDLERTVRLDQDRNGELTWGEALAKVDEVEYAIGSSFTFTRQQQNCTTSFAGQWQLDTHFNEPYLVLPVNAQCALAGDLQVDYSNFFDHDSEHKLLLSLSTAEQSYSQVISHLPRTLTIDAASGSVWATVKEFTKQDAIHIWIGLDHILFLMCLLLASVFTLSKHSSQTMSVRQTSVQILTVVTAFTLAHSLTLAATALNWIQVSSTWVEVGIAISVLAAALNNIYPLVKKITWVTFGFGLLHGMGFAGVLGELGLPSDQKLWTVLAFNLGVEFGQLVIILIALPLMLLINRYNLKPRYFLVVGSSAIGLVAISWIIERLPF